MKAEAICRKLIKAVSSIIDMAVLAVIVLLLAFAGYALWDTQQLYSEAESSRYAVYKPIEEDEGKSFLELQAINPDVFAWLTVYGTDIDYPVVQGNDNMQYVNTNVEGRYSQSGAIFLDSKNKRDFSDFSNILYGHHMEKNLMFGQIGDFSVIEMFETRKYGELYYEGRSRGIEFFAFIHTDAYDSEVFSVVMEAGDRQAYLDGLLAKAVYKRDIGITVDDRIILLSTCSYSSTSGRDLLAGKITDKVFEDPFINIESDDLQILPDSGSADGALRWLFSATLILAALLVIMIIISNRMKQQDETKAGR